MLQTDLVLEGGGVKGAGLAGAVHRLAQDYTFHRVAGTSAGAIVAAFVAAGLQDRLDELTVTTDLAGFLDEGRASRLLGRLGNALDLVFHEGIYRGQALRDWIGQTLASEGVHTFGDLRLPGTTRRTPTELRYRLVVIVSDISRGRMLRLPWDAETLLGVDPDRLCVADAVRASASIPGFFRPWHLPVDAALAHGHAELVLTDGGMLSNFPVDLFDDEADHPTFGVKLSARQPLGEQPWFETGDPLHLGKALVETMTNAHDQRYVDQESVASRTVFVDTTGVKATDFTISPETKMGLFDSGLRAAGRFLDGWDYGRWTATFGVPGAA